MTRKVTVRKNEALVSQTSGVKWRIAVFCMASALCAAAVRMHADHVVMQNGDCYYGRLLSLTTNSLVLQSDVLGTLTLPRAYVTFITLGTVAPTNIVHPPSADLSRAAVAAPTNLVADLSGALRQLGTQTNLIQQVQGQYLDAAGPEAKDKFNQLLRGLITGKLTVDDIRVEAKSAADELRSLKQDLGPEMGDAVDGYLAVLDKFLQEKTPSGDALTNGTVAPLKPKSGPPGNKQ